MGKFSLYILDSNSVQTPKQGEISGKSAKKTPQQGQFSATFAKTLHCKVQNTLNQGINNQNFAGILIKGRVRIFRCRRQVPNIMICHYPQALIDIPYFSVYNWPGLIWVRKAFVTGLSSGGLICRGRRAYMRVKKATETTDTIRLGKKWRSCIILFVYLLIKENLYLKSYLTGPKIGINAFGRLIGGSIYMGGGGGGLKGDEIW